MNNLFYTTKKINFSFLLFVIGVVINGCSGSNSSAPTTATGKFIDGPVGGLTFVSGSTTGTTAPDGTFTYEIGKTVKFSINGIVIGEAPAGPLMTPLHLALTNNPNANTSSPEVVNIVRFLMAASSIDSNGNMMVDSTKVAAPSVSQTLSFSNTTSAFRNMVGGVVPNMANVSVSQAISHLTANINRQYAGKYGGTYSGFATASTSTAPFGSMTSVSGSLNSGGTITAQSASTLGTWTATITTDGTVTGSTSNGETISGIMQNGTMFIGTVGSMLWNGNLNVSNKVLSGTWTFYSGATSGATGRNSGGTIGMTFTGSAI